METIGELIKWHKDKAVSFLDASKRFCRVADASGNRDDAISNRKAASLAYAEHLFHLQAMTAISDITKGDQSLPAPAIEFYTLQNGDLIGYDTVPKINGIPVSENHIKIRNNPEIIEDEKLLAMLKAAYDVGMDHADLLNINKSQREKGFLCSPDQDVIDFNSSDRDIKFNLIIKEHLLK